MARRKTRVKLYRPLVAPWLGPAPRGDRYGHERRIPSTVYLSRKVTAKERGQAFRACVEVGKNTGSRVPRPGGQHNFACATGKNPREAVSRALKTAGRWVAVRKGAFAERRS